MVALPHSNGHSKTDTDSLAREYIESLKRGESPVRPDVGKWAALCDTLEIVAGDANAITKALESFKKNKKFPGLAELLNPSLARPGASQPRLEVVKDNDEGYPPLPQGIALDPSLARGASPSMDTYIEYSRQMSPEAYDPFHETCFVTMLSMVAARRVRIPFNKPDYTPLMSVLIARSGLYKKTTTADVIRPILRSAKLDWFLGQKNMTPQKLVYDMAGTLPKDYADLEYEKKERINQRLAFAGQRGWMSDEFGKFVKGMMNANSPMAAFQSILLEMDNCYDIYDSGTITRGDEIVERPYLAVLACMTPASIRAFAKSGSEFWTDGFWSRFSFVCAPLDDGKDIPFQLGEIATPYTLARDLENWHQRLGIPDCKPIEVLDKKGEPTGRYTVARGEFPEVRCTFGTGVYDAWVRYRSALKSMMKGLRNEDWDGVYERLSTKAIRTACLLASLENHDLIEMRHWAKAQEIAERWRASLHEFYRQVNSSAFGETQAARLEDEIIRTMRRRAQEKETSMSATRLHDYLPKFATPELDKALKELVKVGVVKAEKTSHTMKYELVGLSPVPPAQDEEQIEDLELEEMAL